jgi:hypothetical protein
LIKNQKKISQFQKMAMKSGIAAFKNLDRASIKMVRCMRQVCPQ